MALLSWRVVYDGKTPPPGEVVRPDERLSWPRTVGLGAQHVVAMFGGTFVFPLVMGLNPQLAIMLSGVATIAFLLIVSGKVPSYLGTSASFVGGVVAIRAQGGDSADVTGAILVSGLVLVLVGAAIHYFGAGTLNKVLPPVVTGAVVMLIGFNLAFVVHDTYWPQDQWVALLTLVFVIVGAVGFRGFFGRIAIFLGLIFGYGISWLFDRIFGQITSYSAAAGKDTTHWRVDWSGVKASDWIGFPPHTSGSVVGWHFPSFSITFILLVLPAVIALVAENTAHVKAVGEMTGTDVNPVLGRGVIGDGVGTVIASFFGGSPTTTYAENIGVMAATRIYSTAAYYVAAVVAILLGLSPKFGAVVDATPGAVLAGVTCVLYGMIGMLGAKIWKENRVNLGNPINLVPIAAGIILAIANVDLKFTDNFSLGGIALGTIVAIGGYHLAKLIAPQHMKDDLEDEPVPSTLSPAVPPDPDIDAISAAPAPVVESVAEAETEPAESPVLVADEPGKE